MKIASWLMLWSGATLALRAEVITRPGPEQRPVLEYQQEASPFKPYVAQLYSPAGVAVLRDAPPDHRHHHGLMFAVSVDGVSFWEERATGGRQVPREFRRDGARLRQTLDWQTPDGRRVLVEERTIEFHERTAQPVTLLTWRSRLQAPPGGAGVTLGGSHYYGLGARFAAAMDRDGEFLFPAAEQGDVVRGTERLTRAAWGAYGAAVDGQRVTVALFDDPRNLRHPPRVFTMTAPFAYLAATLNLWKEPHRIEAGRPLELRYGVAVWDGNKERAEIDALYQQWIDRRD